MTKALPGTKAHTVYKTSEGKRVPGVTTITGLLDKSRVLMHWAVNEVNAGRDPFKTRDQSANAGTIAHQLIHYHLRGERPDKEWLADFAPSLIDIAENSVLSYFEWEKEHRIEPILLEEAMVSDGYGYGGTIDLYGKAADGAFELIDFKTGKTVDSRSGVPYIEYRVQTAGGYRLLLEDSGHRVDRVRILHIPRDEDMAFGVYPVGDFETHGQLFLNLLDQYHLLAKLR